MTWLGKLEEAVIALLLAAMTSITFSQVIARYVFGYSFVWALELNTVLFAWLIFIGMSYGVRVGAHIGVDALVRTLGPRAARITAGVATSLCLLYAVILGIGGAIYVMKMYTVGIEMQDFQVPQWVPRLVLPIGFALLALRFGEVMLKLMRGDEVRLLGDEAEDALKLRSADIPRQDSAS